MRDFLTPLQTRSKSELNDAKGQAPPIRSEKYPPGKHTSPLKLPEDVLEALNSKPDRHTLIKALRWLDSNAAADGFNIKKPAPQASQIIYVLVNDIIPSYWVVSNDDKKNSEEKILLGRCLCSIAGIGAIFSHLRLLLDELKANQSAPPISGVSRTQPIGNLLGIAEIIVGEIDFLASVWNDICAFNLSPSQKSVQWKELVSLLASGKLLSLAGESSVTINKLSSTVTSGGWIGDGAQYAAWLGRNVLYMTKTLPKDDVEGRKAISQIVRKALTLGYIGQPVCYSGSQWC